MKSFTKNIVAFGITSALSLGLFSYSHAATYRVIDKNATEDLGFTYAGKLNNQGNMAVSGTNPYDFPVQFKYLDNTDFNRITLLAFGQQNSVSGLGFIEDIATLISGNPTDNDLAWARLYLREANRAVSNFQYQIVSSSTAMINVGEGIDPIELCVFDTDFSGNSCTGELTRSTSSIIESINNTAIVGTATAPYLPLPEFTNSAGAITTHWVREHGQRGFFSLDFGESFFPVVPLETTYSGGISALLDVNDNGTAVGYTSYALTPLGEARILAESGEAQVVPVLDEDQVVSESDEDQLVPEPDEVQVVSDLGEDIVVFEADEDQVLLELGGCADPDILDDIPYEVCVQNNQSNLYYIQASKTVLSDANSTTELLGLLVEPHEDDTRAFTSQALAINNNGVAVGYSHGWNDENVITPSVNQAATSWYAVLFKNGEVFDFNQTHYSFRFATDFSRATDINDSGLVVGYTREPSTFVRKFFYVDTSVPESEMEIIIPKDFFNSSVSSAFAVNGLGVIVGEGQIESHNANATNPRRTAGFMYNTKSASPETIEINTLLACDSAYDIITANDINDSGQISATAIVKSVSIDALGKAILDDSGNPVMVDIARAVLLEPIEGGEVDDCSLTEEKVERQGASFGGLILLALFSLVALRRKSINR